MLARRMFPVLKWAGRKSQLLEQLAERMPAEYNRYYEPFIGSAALLLGIAPAQACINDVNEQLVNLYVQLKRDAESIIAMVNELDATSCTKECYYEIRDKYNTKIASRDFDAECAALMIWINKHCFNGLYRVNAKGLFNVPFNNICSGKSIVESNVRAISAYLQQSDVTITCLDFEKACDGVSSGDFVYFDSPYVSESIIDTFTDYTREGFSASDHQRLAALFKRLDGIGAKVMLSNNDVPLVRSWYDGYNIHSLDVKRLINRDASKRTGKEVLITNY